MRALYEERRSAVVEALRDELHAEALGAHTGMHLVTRLPVRDREVAIEAAKQGLWVMPLSSCYAKTPKTGFVLGYGGVAAKDARVGLMRLRKLCASSVFKTSSR
jgi:DNA-binding transcriptional MocR family regulator